MEKTQGHGLTGYLNSCSQISVLALGFFFFLSQILAPNLSLSLSPLSLFLSHTQSHTDTLAHTHTHTFKKLIEFLLG